MILEPDYGVFDVIFAAVFDAPIIGSRFNYNQKL